MVRKTNLFYLDGIDSNFLTFSNYTESLTGNFLATNYKLYPSRFICLYSDKLANDFEVEKKALIKILISYYENKLALLRDACIANDVNVEDKVLPFAYLLQCLKKWDPNIYAEYIRDDNGKLVKVEDTDNYIPYITDITEQDYNGTYTDTICVVSFNDYYHGYIENISVDFHADSITDDIPTILHGWTNGDLPSRFMEEDMVPIHDEGNDYHFNTDLSNISISAGIADEINFNIIIPLFDLVDINYKTSDVVFNTNDDDILLENDINAKSKYNINCPLGIWTSPNVISIKKDLNTGFSQSWTLAISSQFKPFPYTHNIPTEISDKSKSNSFATFAMVLSRQNDLISKFDSFTNRFVDLSNRLGVLEQRINNIGTISNIDKLSVDLVNNFKKINQDMKEFKNEVNEKLEDLKWKSAL